MHFNVTFHRCKVEAQSHFGLIYNMDLGQKKRRREVIMREGGGRGEEAEKKERMNREMR